MLSGTLSSRAFGHGRERFEFPAARGNLTGECAAGIALQGRLVQFAQALSQAAGTHQAVALAEAQRLHPDTAVVTEDDENGKLWLQGGMCLEIADPESPGDGTVPLTSSSAPGRAGVKASFEHGRGVPAAAPALHNNVKGYDRQGSYNDKAGRSLFAALYVIVRCAQTVSTQ